MFCFFWLRLRSSTNIWARVSVNTAGTAAIVWSTNQRTGGLVTSPKGVISRVIRVASRLLGSWINARHHIAKQSIHPSIQSMAAGTGQAGR